MYIKDLNQIFKYKNIKLDKYEIQKIGLDNSQIQETQNEILKENQKYISKIKKLINKNTIKKILWYITLCNEDLTFKDSEFEQYKDELENLYAKYRNLLIEKQKKSCDCCGKILKSQKDHIHWIIYNNNYKICKKNSCINYLRDNEEEFYYSFHISSDYQSNCDCSLEFYLTQFPFFFSLLK